MVGLQPQRVDAPLTAHATFLTLSLPASPSPEALSTIRTALGSVADLSKNVAIRDPTARFAVTVGLGSGAWDLLLPDRPRPAELHPFREIRGAKHVAVSTPGDVLCHVRAERRDLCFEFERQFLEMLDVRTTGVSVVDSTSGFRYFDLRDLLGFIDGTANPAEAADVRGATLVTAADDGGAGVAGGSYVVVQKYVHDMDRWQALSTEQQEAVIGRRKWDNFELADAGEREQKSHKALTAISDPGTGEELEILRDNMPFGSPGKGQFGTYFIGYSRRLWVIEKMLERMFIGVPEGMHDKILDYSTPLTGCTFFVPAADILAGMADD